MNDRLVMFVMGVSGCGKSSVSEEVSSILSSTYIDADDFHPKCNVDKMKNGIPLNDNDRLPWLTALNRLATTHVVKGERVVVACSCLTPKYRKILQKGIENHVIFVYLKGSFSVINQRMKERGGHYFKGDDMLNSQLSALIEPTLEEGITYIDVDVDNADISHVVDQVIEQLNGGK
jgi:gluconokinase